MLSIENRLSFYCRRICLLTGACMCFDAVIVFVRLSLSPSLSVYEYYRFVRLFSLLTYSFQLKNDDDGGGGSGVIDNGIHDGDGVDDEELVKATRNLAKKIRMRNETHISNDHFMLSRIKVMRF